MTLMRWLRDTFYVDDPHSQQSNAKFVAEYKALLPADKDDLRTWAKAEGYDIE